MAGDLENLMARAAHDLEAALPPAPTDALGHVRAAVRRRRLGRHARDSVGALALVGALATAVLLGGRGEPEPAVTPTPTPSVSATPTPTPAPTATPTPDAAPTGPVVREAEIDDATVLARLAAPRTGEVWTAPQRVDAPGPVFTLVEVTYDWYLVGHRGAADIYAATPESASLTPYEMRSYGLPVELYELEAGVLRRVVCPSARTGDACGQPHVNSAAEQDTTTFYDSLTLPRALPLPGGYTLGTAATSGAVGALTGAMQAVVLQDEVRVHADLGSGVQVVERTIPSHDGAPAGMRSVRFAVRLPYGALVDLVPADVPGGDSAAITWDDGVARGDADDAWRSATGAPGGLVCDFATFSVQTTGVDRSAWVRAGSTADGRPVHVPAPGRTEVAAAVFAWQESSSWTVGDTPTGTVTGAEAYPIDSVEQLVADNALFALEGPGRSWLLGLRVDAMHAVYECS
ncbi:hypothetical protein H9657_09060 [Cellulomonas sp. Sa3CUA2]|uniref:Uncharacterized protein n=1 Tax=Cellulomonas avistercoris TaxID=2762242 RepID=A0ABR8QDC6_9CELL|nr:hypothetical protein [Cellulomonas avistercoris]MBD7918425.1 hypothetical protein [Cellulomonas avistercoris]